MKLWITRLVAALANILNYNYANTLIQGYCFKETAKKLKKILKQNNALREEQEDQSISANNTEGDELNKLLSQEEVLRNEIEEQQEAFN